MQKIVPLKRPSTPAFVSNEFLAAFSKAFDAGPVLMMGIGSGSWWTGWQTVGFSVARWTECDEVFDGGVKPTMWRIGLVVDLKVLGATAMLTAEMVAVQGAVAQTMPMVGLEIFLI